MSRGYGVDRVCTIDTVGEHPSTVRSRISRRASDEPRCSGSADAPLGPSRSSWLRTCRIDQPGLDRRETTYANTAARHQQGGAAWPVANPELAATLGASDTSANPATDDRANARRSSQLGERRPPRQEPMESPRGLRFHVTIMSSHASGRQSTGRELPTPGRRA